MTHGSYHQQPEPLDTMTYGVEFDDGLVKNTQQTLLLADEVFVQADDEGFITNHMDGIGRCYLLT
jgi:hypothetical protein